MRIKDLKPRAAASIERGESLRAAAKCLAEDETGALIVFGATGAEGVFSERDLVRAIADDVDIDEEPVQQYMTEAPITVDKDGPLGDAIAKMNEYSVRHLVTVDGGNVIGMISMRDIVGLLGTAWPEL